MTRQRNIINYLLVYMLLFVSGSWRYNLSDNKYLVICFIIAVSTWYLFSDRKISDRFIIYISIFASLLIALNIYTGGSLTFMSVISATMKFVLAYLILATVKEEFLEKYIKVVVFLAAVSLFGYTTDLFNLWNGIITKLPRVGDLGYEGFLYVYRFDWHIERNNSIFFEPGAYEGFLNAAILFTLFGRVGLSVRQKGLFLFILVVTLVTTFSTTGYLIFGVTLVLFFIKSELISFKGKVYIAMVAMIMAVVFSNQFHEVIVQKVTDYINADEYGFGYSAESRGAATQTDIKLFKQNVFGLGQLKYLEEFSKVGRTDKKGSGNGITKVLAMYGFPFAIFLFLSYFIAIRRLARDNLLGFAAFTMYLMFLTGESFYVTSPISYAIISAAFIFGATRGNSDCKQRESISTETP